METYCRDNHLPSKNLSDSACNKLLSHTWPGNVRELKSVIELAIVMCTGDSILADDIILSHPGFLSESLTEEMTLKEYNQHILRFYLNKYDRNITLVAQKLGIGQATIYRMMKER
jgi:transcriptional regulator of acetoin/glycerol metabolism